MSEKNNLESNHLCTTEDAFEKFQSDAMFGEDEYITLSDIVSPQPEVPDISNELNEIPYDNEVILASNDEVKPPKDGLKEPGPNNELTPQNLDQSTNEYSGKDCVESCNEQNRGTYSKKNKNQKRGKRKEKSLQDETSYQSEGSYLETENNSLINNQDNVHSTTIDKNGTESSNDGQGPSKYPRRTRRERIPNTSKYPIVTETPFASTPSNKTPGKRRGRPKKSSLENTIISEPDSTNMDSSLVNEESSSAENNKTEPSKTVGKRGRRGRPKASNIGLEPINHNESSNLSECADTDLPLSELKKPTRRGRKRVSKSVEESPNITEEFSQHVDALPGTQLDGNKLPVIVEPLDQDEQMHPASSNLNSDYETGDMDIEDDICLSKIKENINSITEGFSDSIEENMLRIHGGNENSANGNVSLPKIADFEDTIDKIAKETSMDSSSQLNNGDDKPLLVEDTSKRPNRRKTKQNFKYQVDSDEDPFANVELSDDDEPKSRKKSKYTDDYEYIPGSKRGLTPVTSTDSEINEDSEDDRRQKRKKVFGQSPKKRGRKSIKLDDSERIPEPPLPKLEDAVDEPLSMKPPAEAWATSNEFENFIAQKIQGPNLKVKKVSLRAKSDHVVLPLDIPVVKQQEPKRFIEMCTQTSKPSSSSIGIQTSVPYDIPMRVNLPLSSKQSEKACEFMSSVVKTTAELGQLMKDKSEDFMKKKINMDNVTDTFKMDYCVRKSFLLFKLAKHNLMQMEEDLAKQYDEFLRSNNLSNCREEVKNIAAKPKQQADSDSDCEIVDVKEGPTTSEKQEKPKASAKTVFLNKELSIKIAKKSSTSENVNVKGRNTIWINDSVMVKKVKPTQSFLAQDSRNKKPPDYVTEKMVSDFFENYYRHQRMVAVCAPFVSTEWSVVRKEYACHYFVKCNDFDEPGLNTSESMDQINTSTSDGNSDYVEAQKIHKNDPKPLSSLCAEVVRSCLHDHYSKQANEDLTCDLTDGKIKNGPLSLFRLCYQSLPCKLQCNMSKEPPIVNDVEEKFLSLTVLPLKYMCYKRILQLMPLDDEDKYVNSYTSEPDVLSDCSSYFDDIYSHDDDKDVSQIDALSCLSNVKKESVKSLFKMCVCSIQTILGISNNKSDTIYCKDLKKIKPLRQIECLELNTRSPKSLKDIAYENIRHLMHGDKEHSNDIVTSGLVEESNICSSIENTNDESLEKTEDFTINCINTLSEEAFHSLDVADEFQDEDDYEDYEPDIEDYTDDNEGDANEWVSQVQMQELRSCITPVNGPISNDCEETSIDNTCDTPVINSIGSEFVDTNIGSEPSQEYQNEPHSTLDNIAVVPHIKLEPQDDTAENIVDSSIVKTEPVHGLDGMTIIPESIITKSELMEPNTGTEDNAEIGDSTGIETDTLAASSVYDLSTFGKFVKKNKMVRSMDDEDSDDEGIFGRSFRERREHEPDYDAGNDPNESLLIPQTFEPLHFETAKGVLMESSSDESKDGSKKTGKKKVEKKKGKQKKGKEVTKNNATKDIPVVAKEVAKEVVTPVKDKAPTNEVAILTRKMREKIRQEEKKIESSDSESDNIALSLRKDKSKAKEIETIKPTKSAKKGESSSSKEVDNEIQCNNVDSTEQNLENKDKNKAIVDEFTGFSAIDQNEISSYQKFMKYVYDKIVPGDEATDHDNGINETNENTNRPTSPLIRPDQPVELLECEPTMPIFDDENAPKPGKRPKKSISKKKETTSEKDEPKFTERDGWHIYPMNSNDKKLYQNCHIPLEKLPESFVDIYLQYQDITVRDVIDKEIDKLANLHTLNRATSLKEAKTKGRLKGKSSSVSEQNSADVSRAASPAPSDRFDELSPSEDEGANVDFELPPPVSLRATENNIAKDSLMDDHESDSECGTKKIKQEPKDSIEVEEKRKPGPKSKTKMDKAKVDNLPSSQSLILTADKMLNKELNLLHAPIVMKEEAKEHSSKEPSPKDESKPKKRSLRNVAMRYRLKTEDDSSSEEEKQWVCTKEKLLKRVGRKEDATADDAKRAKLVDDFIVRRGEGPENRRISTRSSRRSRKKFLERIKQQRVLSKELYGEPSTDLTPGGKRSANVGLFKGRRNIRKVIDKKSLQKSTVLANMEEFERKRRLNSKQNQLRELLGCEEGVNVLVINDEVCLEYDFEEQRPVVTVHPFFTKVMKAHQYEGVKFMWDACFESLASIESGRGGGGCILAHCMGLGKTLQVLALLHTVLTHPRCGMHRVLVCCPLSTVLNWVDEIHKWIGPVTDQIKVFELSKLKKTYERAYQLEDWYNGGGIFIIGYELFRSLTTLDPLIDEVRPTIINKIRTALLDPGPDIIICDEGHLLKNDCSVLAVAMSRVVTKRRIVLTGTPMQNNLREYYCMVNFVKPNLLGTYAEYSNRFENPIMNGQHRDSREEDIKLMKARTHILHKVLEGCLQRQEASVLYPYLPKKHEYTVFIPLTKCQWELYKHYVHHYTKKSKQSILRDFHILQKIWSHPLVLHNFQTRYHAKKKEIKPEKIEDDLALEDKEDIKPPDTETWWLQYLADGAMLNSIDSSNKFVAVFRILHECIELGDKVLIFSTSLDCLDALECFLREINGWNLGQEYYRLDGSVPAEVRQKWVREYNAENNHKTKLFLISTRAGCLGLNMTAANRVIILDTSWNPAHDIQSIFRVYRFGQKKDCYIYRLVAMGTMEQKIYERSVTKQAVACRVVDEQQIDRHYNMAELTELYKFDEHGVGVAGGVAVGVADVALLRVARDAAVHAVHEHDSLLRGSGEQGLPEHERAAAWMQFQQEHAHKQMQNDIETDLAARALKKQQDEQQVREQLEQQRLEAQRQLLEKQQAQVLNIKTEDGPVHDLLVPREVQPPTRGRGGHARGRRRGKVVQCRIPIRPDQPGPSRTPITEEEMVQQISDILIKYNFTQTGKGPQQVKELVAKVKRMIQTGKPMQLEGCDDLTASIARVLLQKQEGAAPKPAPVIPPLTEIEPESKRRGRPRRPAHEARSATPIPAPPEQEATEQSAAVGGRLRRRAAIQAERQFDMIDDGASQDSVLPEPVIEVDDDDWQAAPDSDTDSAPECVTDAVKPVDTKPVIDKKTKRLTVYPLTSKKPPEIQPEIRAPRQDDSSIVVSDDEAPPVPTPPSQPVAKPSTATKNKSVTPLHTSLLTNQNFIKIVAHTYLAGNPMLDEDAATLAAQYSTLKLLKEAESTGKPIESGPIYDIAMKILGEPVLQKLHLQDDAKSKESGGSNVASSKMMQFLGQNTAPEPAPAPVKRRPGPKSRVRPIKDEPQDAPTHAAPTHAAPPHAAPPHAAPPHAATTPSTRHKGIGVVPVNLLRGEASSAPPGPTPAPPAQAAGECILPDDDDVRCLAEPASAPATQKPLIKVKLLKKELNQKLKAVSEVQKVTALRVTAGGGPAAAKPGVSASPGTSYATISLDSDDEEPPAPPRTTRSLAQQAAAGGPVPVALTGPDSKPIPLAVPQPARAPSQPSFYPYPSAVRYPPEPVPVSLTGPDAGPVPVSLTGPNNRPVPVSLTGPGFEAVPLSLGAGEPQPAPPALAPLSFLGPDGVPISFAGGQHSVPMSFASGTTPMPMTFTVPSAAGGGVRPVAMTYSGGALQGGAAPGGVRAMRLTLQPGQAAAGLQQLKNNFYLMPTSAPQQVQPAPPPVAAPQPTYRKTVCKPGDILCLTPSGQLEIIKSADVVHTIDDDDPPPAPAPASPAPTADTKTSVLKNKLTSKSQPSAPKPPKSEPKAPKPEPKAPKPEPKAPTQTPKAPALTQKTSLPAPTILNTKIKEQERRKRRLISSSSSSDSSRSNSPDPLSILRDVVHIQAPERKSKRNTTAPPPDNTDSYRLSTAQPKQTSKSKTTPSQTKSTPKPAPEASSKKDNVIAKKLSDILTAVKSNKSATIAAASKAAMNSKAATANIQDSIDLTEISFKPAKANEPSKTSKPTSSTKKDGPTTVVGTSKNIILDGRSKSLTKKDTMDLTGQKSVHVTKVKAIPPSTATNKPPEKKRAAPSTDVTATKKKKTEPMTLKDFDIDDIDDIIELD